MQRNFRRGFVSIIILLLAFTVAGCGSSSKTNDNASSYDSKQGEAAAPKSDFPKRDIEFVVGYKPGGGYSDWAQAIAPFIEKHLPNKVNVLVRHMEGAGSAIAANHLQKAKPDGYTIGIYNLGGLAGTQLAREVEYDLQAVTWLARLSLDPAIATVSSKSPFNTIQDLKNKEKVIMSTKGLAANATITGAATFDEMGVKWTPLNHDGTGESVLAVIRGDADITWGSIDSQKQYIDSGDLKMLLYYDSQRHPDYPDVPIPSEAGLPVEINEAFNTHRLIGAPPGLPEDEKAILEDAIKKAVEDPEFQEVLKKMEMTTNYLNGSDTANVVEKTLKGFENYKDVVKDLLSKGKK
jgi:tripartite-type tricarboxylate transporter receptor subunit TctC